jgi:PAS domain S-box-containing protein
MTEHNERSVAHATIGGAQVTLQRTSRHAKAILHEQTNLLDLTHDAILVRDMRQTITYWNRGAENLYGWASEEALGRNLYDLLKAVFPTSLEEAEEEVMAAGRWEGELVHTKRGGGQVVVASHWFLQRDENGVPVSVLSTNDDVTERKRSEALFAGERRVLEMVAKGDPIGRILDSLCRHVEDYAPDVLASILLIEDGRVKHGAAPSLPRAYIDAIDGLAIGPRAGSCGTAAYFGKQIIVSDIAGDPLWADYLAVASAYSLRACWSTPVISSEGKVIATFAMYYREPRSPSIRDLQIIEQITHLAGVAIQRKLTEERLQRSEAYLAEAQKLTHTGSWAWSPRGDKVLYCSEEMFRLFGLDPQQDLPIWTNFRQRIHPDDRERIYAKFEKALREKTDTSEEYRVVLPDGTLRYISARAHPVLDKDGELIEFLGTARDVTERKRAEEEREKLRQLEAKLVHVNRVTTMGELAASLAHELNQPITAASTNANACLRWLTRDHPDWGEATEAAIRIVKDATRAGAMIHRLRSLYKKDMPPRREKVDVNEIAGEMLGLLRDEAERYSVMMRTDFCPVLPKLTADRVQLQQALMNLMLNGIEAMQDTAGELTVRSAFAQDGQVLISISDTGVGLPSEKTDQIFNHFFTRKPQGTGMGLAISRSIVESHGGRLWATSNPGPGATFYITLPVEMAKAS